MISSQLVKVDQLKFTNWMQHEWSQKTVGSQMQNVTQEVQTSTIPISSIFRYQQTHIFYRKYLMEHWNPSHTVCLSRNAFLFSHNSMKNQLIWHTTSW